MRERERERESECERERERESECERERECVCERERESVCESVSVRERLSADSTLGCNDCILTAPPNHLSVHTVNPPLLLAQVTKTHMI